MHVVTSLLGESEVLSPFASTYFHLPDNLVDREPQSDATEPKVCVY